MLYFAGAACENILVLASARLAANLEIAMSIKRPSSQPGPGSQPNQDLAFAMQIGPIGYADLAVVQVAMAEIAPDWSVELHAIRTDDATLVLLPEGGDDAMGPSFMISRETYGFRLDQVHWDVLTEFGVFASLNDVVAMLAARLAFYPDLAVPATITLH
jgi:hypothetical protein